MAQLIHTENFRLANIGGSVSGIILKGGEYSVSVSATFGGGSVTLKILAGDDTTYVTCLAAFTQAGYATVYLPQGTYQVAIATASAVYVDIRAIPIYSKE